MLQSVYSFLIFVTLLTSFSCRRINTEYVTVALPEKFTTFDTLTSTASDASADRVRNLVFNSLVKKNESFDYVEAEHDAMHMATRIEGVYDELLDPSLAGAHARVEAAYA